MQRSLSADSWLDISLRWVWFDLLTIRLDCKLHGVYLLWHSEFLDLIGGGQSFMFYLWKNIESSRRFIAPGVTPESPCSCCSMNTCADSLWTHNIYSEFYHNTVPPPGFTEIPAPDGGLGSDITNEGLKLQTIGGLLSAGDNPSIVTSLPGTHLVQECLINQLGWKVIKLIISNKVIIF